MTATEKRLNKLARSLDLGDVRIADGRNYYALYNGNGTLTEVLGTSAREAERALRAMAS